MIHNRGLCSVTSFIDNTFKQHLIPGGLSQADKTGMELRQSILGFAYQESVKNNEAPSRLFQLIEAIPDELSLDDKAQWLSNNLITNAAMPVITVHPTGVLSNKALFELTYITDDLMLLKQNKVPFEQVPAFKETLAQTIIDWASQPMVPSKNLTPQDEAKFALFLYKRAIASFPAFRKDVIAKFLAEHGGDETYITGKLNGAITKSYRNIFSWCMADFDGNSNRTRKTIAITLPSQQHAILEMYIASIKRILNKLDNIKHAYEIKTLQDMHDYFERCVKAIDSGIWFDLKGSQKTAKRSKLDLENLSLSFQMSNNTHEQVLAQEILALRDLIDLAGFFGGLKEYIRQTTQLNKRVLSELFSLLVMNHEDIQQIMGDVLYDDVSLEKKKQLLELLRKEPKYFETLKLKSDSFTAETKQEMERLSFILDHSDLFPSYITSDTDNKNNFDEVLMLLRFSSFLCGTLRIGQIREHALNTLPLCETPKDLGRFIEMAYEMFDDPSIRNRIIESGFFSYVGGPSDLGKKGGILVYVSLLQVQLQALMLLKKYKGMDPRLQDVLLRVLHGFGGDMKRRNGSSANELHSTQQGLEAWRVLGATGAYSAFLHRVIGLPSESYFRALELSQLSESHPHALDALFTMVEQGTTVYQNFIESKRNKQLLMALTSLSLEKCLNVSSRAGAKINLEDPTNVRAIGVVNLYLLTGIQWDVFMSMVGLLNLPKETTEHFPCLFNELTVMKDIVYKVMFTLAVSDFPSAWQTINSGEIPSPQQLSDWATMHEEGQDIPEELASKVMLAYINVSAERILMQSIQCFPAEQQLAANAYLQKSKQNNVPIHQMANGVMMAMGGKDLARLVKESNELRVHFDTLAKCVKAYKKKPTPKNTENAVLACRAIPLAAGPNMISDMVSHLRHEALMKPENIMIPQLK